MGNGGSPSTVLSPTFSNQLSNVAQISAGTSFSLALTNDGHVYSFGSNTVIFNLFSLDNLDLVIIILEILLF